jgi:hypothetical protein
MSPNLPRDRYAGVDLMPARLPRVFRESRPPDEPLYYARTPEDALADPRLTRSEKELIGQIMRRVFDGTRTILISQGSLAARCMVSTRTIRRNIVGIERCGYMTFDRDPTIKGSPWVITLQFNLRKALVLKSEPADNHANASTRTKTSGITRTKTSGITRTKTSAPSLFERESLETTTTRADETGTSSSFSSSDRAPGPLEPDAPPEAPGSPRSPAAPVDPPIPGPDATTAPRAAQADPSMAAMLAQAVARWPGYAAELPLRVADLVAVAQTKTPFGAEGAALALEYAALMPESIDVGRAFYFLRKWGADDLPIADVRAMVDGRRRLVADGKRPKPAGRDVGEFRPPVVEPEDPDAERLKAEALARWRAMGIRTGSSGRVRKEPAAGYVAKPPPRPAGVACSSVRNPTLDKHPGQGKSAEKQAFEGRASPVKELDSG